jgi:hypothetical protein
MPAMYAIYVGKELVMKKDDLDTIKAYCTAFQIRSNRGRCDRMIRIKKGSKLIARSTNWNIIRPAIEEWEAKQ